MKKRYMDIGRLRKMKKIKLTEKISERYDSARAALLFCYCSYSSSPEWLALGYS